MSIRRALAILRKELRHITRDGRVLFLVTLAPAFLLLMLSYVFSFDVERVDVAVLDLDHSALSRDYVSTLASDGDFRITARAQDRAEIEALLLPGKVALAIIIPHGFEANLRQNRTADVLAVVDGMNAISAGQAIGQIRSRTLAYGASLIQSLATATAAASPEVRSRVWFNPALKSLYGMVPGLMAVVLFMPAMAVTLALAREKETGSFESLIATPVRGIEYLAGKLVAYIITGLAGALAAWLIAVVWFQVPFRGSLVTFFLLTSLYFAATMGIGVLIANFVKSQQTAMTIVLLAFFVPSFFISGLINPMDITSVASRITSYSLPTTHFIIITRALFLKGLDLQHLWQPAAMLIGISAVTLTAGLLLFRKKIR